MKTAVSIPAEIFEESERLATEMQTSRSQHSPDRLTDAMNRIVDEVGGETDEFTRRAARRVLEQVEW